MAVIGAISPRSGKPSKGRCPQPPALCAFGDATLADLPVAFGAIRRLDPFGNGAQDQGRARGKYFNRLAAEVLDIRGPGPAAIRMQHLLLRQSKIPRRPLAGST